MGRFSSMVSKHVAKAKQAAEDVPRKVAIDLFSSIVRDTPVDTGRARGEWQVSKGAPKTEETGLKDKSGSRPTQDIITTAQKVGADEEIILRNNLPYVHSLEYDGISKKAPEGMVRRNVARFESITEKIAREVK